MERNDQQFLAQKIRTQYVEKESTELDSLRELDARVKRPANIFAYAFGSISAIIMGAGMSRVRTELGEKHGVASAMPVGIIIGTVGLALSLINYPIYKKLLNRRKRKYADEIISISDKIMNK